MNHINWKRKMSKFDFFFYRRYTRTILWFTKTVWIWRLSTWIKLLISRRLCWSRKTKSWNHLSIVGKLDDLFSFQHIFIFGWAINFKPRFNHYIFLHRHTKSNTQKTFSCYAGIMNVHPSTESTVSTMNVSIFRTNLLHLIWKENI